MIENGGHSVGHSHYHHGIGDTGSGKEASVQPSSGYEMAADGGGFLSLFRDCGPLEDQRGALVPEADMERQDGLMTVCRPPQGAWPSQSSIWTSAGLGHADRRLPRLLPVVIACDAEWFPETSGSKVHIKAGRSTRGDRD